MVYGGTQFAVLPAAGTARVAVRGSAGRRKFAGGAAVDTTVGVGVGATIGCGGACVAAVGRSVAEITGGAGAVGSLLVAGSGVGAVDAATGLRHDRRPTRRRHRRRRGLPVHGGHEPHRYDHGDDERPNAPE